LQNIVSFIGLFCKRDAISLRMRNEIVHVSVSSMFVCVMTHYKSATKCSLQQSECVEYVCMCNERETSVLQCVAVCCSVLQCVAVCMCNERETFWRRSCCRERYLHHLLQAPLRATVPCLPAIVCTASSCISCRTTLSMCCSVFQCVAVSMV